MKTTEREQREEKKKTREGDRWAFIDALDFLQSSARILHRFSCRKTKKKKKDSNNKKKLLVLHVFFFLSFFFF